VGGRNRKDYWERLEIYEYNYEIVVGIPEGMRPFGRPERN
jgi:hypothetical protein